MEPYCISSDDQYESNQSCDEAEFRDGHNTKEKRKYEQKESGGKVEEKWRNSGDVG